METQGQPNRPTLGKKLANYGFWLGVILACLPLVMYLFGNTRQWQLHHAWDTARLEAAPDPGADIDSSPSDDGLVRLRIPRLHVDAMVVGSTSNAALATGPGHFPSTALPGAEGNCAIAAHRNIWGCWFANLNELEPGDKVILETLKRHFVYKVTGSDVVEPDDTSVLQQHGHKREVTLVTCTLPPTQRIVVHGILDHTSTS